MIKKTLIIIVYGAILGTLIGLSMGCAVMTKKPVHLTLSNEQICHKYTVYGKLPITECAPLEEFKK